MRKAGELFLKAPLHLFGDTMAFELPDYSYGVADAALECIDLLLRLGTDSENNFAKKKLEEAKAAMNDYKAAIFDQVMQT